MIWGILLFLLVALVCVALMWKPKKGPASAPVSIPAMFTSAPIDSELEEDIRIIAESLRQAELDRRKAHAMDRLAKFQAGESKDG